MKHSYIGVARAASRRWQARIAERRTTRYLGTFRTPELAALAYDHAARNTAVPLKRGWPRRTNFSDQEYHALWDKHGDEVRSHTPRLHTA